MLWINLGHWTSNLFVQALFWTLLHSLWEGVLLAVFASMVIILTRKAAASLRYNLFAGLLALFLCSTAVTLVIQVVRVRALADAVSRTGHVYQGTLSVYRLVDGGIMGGNPAQTGIAGWPDRVIAWAGHWAPYLMAAWALVFFVKCAQL